MDTPGAMVMEVWVERATNLGNLQDPKQARSLGQKHWPSKQGVLTGISGQAMNKLKLEDHGQANGCCLLYYFQKNEGDLTRDRVWTFLFWIFLIKRQDPQVSPANGRCLQEYYGVHKNDRMYQWAMAGQRTHLARWLR